MNHLSPLIPTTVRPGYSVIATEIEMLIGANNTKTVTPFLAAQGYIGYYNANRAYLAGQCVYSGGGFYTALLDVQGIAPGNTTYWAPTIQFDTSGFAQLDPGGGVKIGANWTIRQVGTELHFLYDNAVKLKSTNAGLVTALNDVRAFGPL